MDSKTRAMVKTIKSDEVRIPIQNLDTELERIRWILVVAAIMVLVNAALLVDLSHQVQVARSQIAVVTTTATPTASPTPEVTPANTVVPAVTPAPVIRYTRTPSQVIYTGFGDWEKEVTGVITPMGYSGGGEPHGLTFSGYLTADNPKWDQQIVVFRSLATNSYFETVSSILTRKPHPWVPMRISAVIVEKHIDWWVETLEGPEIPHIWYVAEVRSLEVVE